MSKLLTVQDVHSAVEAMRKESFNSTPQITLGELLEALEGIPTEYGSDKKPVSVEFDFGTAYPTGLSSWRGSYSELAINYDLAGYDDFGRKDVMFNHTDLKDLKGWLKEALGKTYTGWKGGDFTMDKDTPVWVANDGNVGNTGVIGVLNQEYTVVILTAYCEY